MDRRDAAPDRRGRLVFDLRRLLSSPDGRALITGMVVFVAGFGAMNLFWWLGDWPSGVDGLWDFRSATIGDGLLLPVAAAILVASAGRLPEAARERSVVRATALAGAISGVVVLVVWLTDPNPQLNWTLPAPHTLNAAGKYHAVLLVLASGFFSGCTMRLLWRVRSLRTIDTKRVEELLHAPLAAILIGCGFGFGGLVLVDSYPSDDGVGSLAAMGAILAGCAVAAGLLVWSFGKSLVTGWRTIGLGGLLATGLAMSTWRSDKGGGDWGAIFVLVGTTSGAIWIQLWLTRNRLWWIRGLAVSLLLLGGIHVIRAIAVTHLAHASILALVIVAMIGVLLRTSGDWIFARAAWILTLALVLPVELMILARWLAVPANAAEYAGPVISVSATIGLGVLIGFGRDWFDALPLEDRRSRATLFRPGRELDASFWAGWSAICGYLVATVASLFAMISGARYELPFDTPGAPETPHLTTVFVGGGIAAMLAPIAIVRTRSMVADHARPTGNQDFELELQPTWESTLWLIAAASAWAIAPWIATSGVDIRTTDDGLVSFAGIYYVLALYVAVCIGIGTTESVWSHTAFTQMLRLNGRGRLAAVACGLAAGATIVWLLTGGIRYRGEPVKVIDIALTMLIILFGNVALAVVYSWVLALFTPDVGATPRYISQQHPATFMLNDSVLYSALVVLWAIVLLTISRVLDLPGPRQLQAIGFLVSFLGVTYGLSNYAYVAQDRFLRDETAVKPVERASMLARVRGDIFPRDGTLVVAHAEKLNAERIDRTRLHVHRQQRLGRFVAPYSLIAVVVWLYRRLVPKVPGV